MTEQEQIEEIAKYVCNVCDFKCDWFQSGMKEDSICTTAQETAKAIYNAVSNEIDDLKAENKQLKTECALLDAELRIARQDTIKRLKAENSYLLKACEGQFTFGTTENKKYSVFNSVRKEFAEKLKKYSYTDNCFTDGKWHRYVLVSDINELLKEYENGKQI